MLPLLNARAGLPNRIRLASLLRFAKDFPPYTTGVNKRAITDHYTIGNDFYLTFIDHRYRFYSNCIFESDDENWRRPPSTNSNQCFEGSICSLACACWILERVGRNVRIRLAARGARYKFD
jgi:hypothetical protein